LRLAFVVAQTLSGLQLESVTVCLHMLMSYDQVESLKTKSGLLVLRSIFARASLVLPPFLFFLVHPSHRPWCHQFVSQPRLPHEAGSDTVLRLWSETFSGFFKAMSAPGYFCALLRLATAVEEENENHEDPPSATEGGGSPPAETSFVGLAHVWDLLLLLSLLLTPSQKVREPSPLPFSASSPLTRHWPLLSLASSKDSLFGEIQVQLEEALMNPARTRHHQAILSLVLRLQKDHLYPTIFHNSHQYHNQAASPFHLPPPATAFSAAAH